MYTAYLIFAIILIISFITGIAISLVEHEPKITNQVVNHIIIDQEII